MKLEINKPLVPMKAHYFLWNAGTGPIVPYLSLYARQLGFSSVVVGLIYTILPVSGMIAKPLFGALADRFQIQKLIFLTAQLVTAVAFISIFYAPQVPNNVEVKFSCIDNISIFHNIQGTNIDDTLLEKIENKQTSAVCRFSCKDLPESCVGAKVDQPACSDAATSAFSALVPLSETTSFGDPRINQKLNTSNKIVEFKATNLTWYNKNICLENTTFTCNIECSDTDIAALLVKNEISDDEVYSTYQFWVFLLLMVIGWVGQAVSVSIGDAICFEMLGDKPNRYGYQRMYGALGWGLLTLITGVLVDVISKDKSYTDYSICFYLAAAFLVVDFIVSSFLKYNQSKLSTSILKDVGKLLIDIRIIVFLGWCICVGMCTGLIWQFLLWLVADLGQVRGDERIQTLQGIIMGVQCLGGELPFFFLSGKILKRIGHINAMSVVLVSLGVRFVLYSVIKNPWYFIPIEFSNGLTFGLFYACMASYASIVAPPGTEATMQGLVGAVFEGVGVSLGSFLGGLGWSKVLGPLTFRYFGFGTLAACAIHLILQHWLKMKDSSSSVMVKKNSFEKVRLDEHRELASIDPLISR